MMLAIIVSSITAIAQTNGKISGKITDGITGEPLQGATVTVKRTNNSVTTASDGSFTLSNVKPGRATLVISYIGFADKETTLSVPDGGEATLNSTLQTSTKTED